MMITTSRWQLGLTLIALNKNGKNRKKYLHFSDRSIYNNKKQINGVMITDTEKKSSRRRKEKGRTASGETGLSNEFYRNFTKSRPKKPPKVEDKTGKRFRTSKVFNEKYPEFLKLLYRLLFLGEGNLFVRKDTKYLTISENKLSRLIECSSSTARKCMEHAELDGLIKRSYVTEYHSLGTPMSIQLTEKGRKYLHEKFFEPRNPEKEREKPRTPEKEGENPQEKNSENKKSADKIYSLKDNNKNKKNIYIYKSTRAREIKFKNHDDSILAKAWRIYFSITGKTERVTKAKSAYLHHAINVLSNAFYEKNTENLLSIFTRFLKSQLSFLRKPSFNNIFKLSCIRAYINKLKSNIQQQEQEAQEMKNSEIFSFRCNGDNSLSSILDRLFENTLEC